MEDDARCTSGATAHTGTADETETARMATVSAADLVSEALSDASINTIMGNSSDQHDVITSDPTEGAAYMARRKELIEALQAHDPSQVPEEMIEAGIPVYTGKELANRAATARVVVSNSNFSASADIQSDTAATIGKRWICLRWLPTCPRL